MGKREDLARQLEPLLERGAFEELERVLVAGSNLPGPRGNLELAAALADVFSAVGAGEHGWEMLCRWAALSAREAPTGDPREFLPFCALEAAGALYLSADPARREQILGTLRAAAGDPRWRLREAVAIGFQRILGRDFPVVEDLFSRWIDGASLLERRAILAALAHPPALKEAGRGTFCLRVADRILAPLAALEVETRRSEEFRVLRMGLEYALSVFAESAPEEGFALLARWAVVADPDVRRIVRSNLGKARLAKKHPARVQEVLAILDRVPGT